MKIKYNIQAINIMKEKVKTFKGKIKDYKGNKKNQIKYYTLLILMLALGFFSLTNNIKKYNKSRKENYEEYSLKEKSDIYNNSNVVASNEKVYLTAESSIYTTDESGFEKSEQMLATISNNNNNITMPVNGEIIKEYAMDKLVYSKTLEMWNVHPGIDISAPIGTQVLSASDGKVTNILNDDFYGNTLIIEDDTYVYKYSNLDDDINIEIGNNVKKGDIIGSIGISAKGELQDESHLHFEVLKDNSLVNPLDLFDFVE